MLRAKKTAAAQPPGRRKAEPVNDAPGGFTPLTVGVNTFR